MRSNQSKQQQENEDVTVLDAGAMPPMTEAALRAAEAATAGLRKGNEVKGSALLNTNREAAPVRRFRVVKGGPIADRGNRTYLRAGKEIDALNYDFVGIQKQGIVLEEITNTEGQKQNIIT